MIVGVAIATHAARRILRAISPCGAIARKIHCRMKFEDITQIQMTLTDTGTLWLTEPETAVIVIVYVPSGVPGTAASAASTLQSATAGDKQQYEP